MSRYTIDRAIRSVKYLESESESRINEQINHRALFRFLQDARIASLLSIERQSNYFARHGESS